MTSNGVQVDKSFSDIKSGMHLDRKGFIELLTLVQNNEVAVVYVTYKDRLARLGYPLVEKLFAMHGTKIEILDKSSTSDEEELFKDLMGIIHSFSMKLYSRRRIAKKLLEG